jgi:hypothetical protein
VALLAEVEGAKSDGLEMGKSVPAGPSTSAELNRVARKPRRLTRREFEMRLFARVRRLYGLQLDDGWLHDLIKDGLIPGADDRKPNVGLKPVYTYGFRSYRRAHQIARLRRDGFVERDAIRVQLFLKGYGERDISQTLWNQYSTHGRNLAAQVRSGYADNWKRVPDGHKSSLMKQMGPLDPRLVAAGFQLDDDKYIDFLRAAKQKDLSDLDKSLPLANLATKFIRNPLQFGDLSDHFGDLVSGLLMFSAIDYRSTPGLDPIEEIIRQSTAEQYEQAREFFRFMTLMSGLQILSGLRIGQDAEARRDALKALLDSVRGDPRWAVSLLVVGLRLSRMFGSGLKANGIWAVIRDFQNNNMNLSHLIGLLQSHENKKT